MEHPVNVKIRMEYNGNHWILYANKVPLNMKFADKKTALVVQGAIKAVLPGLAEAISLELEK